MVDCFTSMSIDDRSLHGRSYKNCPRDQQQETPLCSDQSSRTTDVNFDCMVVKNMFLSLYLSSFLKPDNIRKVRKILLRMLYMHFSLCHILILSAFKRLFNIRTLFHWVCSYPRFNRLGLEIFNLSCKSSSVDLGI